MFPGMGNRHPDDGHGMGDDPYFIDQFGNVDRGAQRGVDGYFNYDASDGAHDLLGRELPASLAAVFG